MPQPEDIARTQLYESIEKSVNADQKLRKMTDIEIADLLLEIYGKKESFSLEETLLSNVRERLIRAANGEMVNE